MRSPPAIINISIHGLSSSSRTYSPGRTLRSGCGVACRCQEPDNLLKVAVTFSESETFRRNKTKTIALVVTWRDRGRREILKSSFNRVPLSITQIDRGEVVSYLYFVAECLANKIWANVLWQETVLWPSVWQLFKFAPISRSLFLCPPPVGRSHVCFISQTDRVSVCWLPA